MSSSRPMVHAVDPRQKLLDEIGDFSGVEVTGLQVLCAIYKRPEKTAGGIILTDNVRDEDRYQGKVGLVLKMGPLAFHDEGDGRFGDLGVENGRRPEECVDWLFYKVSDGLAMQVNGVDCRLIEDENVKGRVSHPDIIW